MRKSACSEHQSGDDYYGSGGAGASRKIFFLGGAGAEATPALPNQTPCNRLLAI